MLSIPRAVFKVLLGELVPACTKVRQSIQWTIVYKQWARFIPGLAGVYKMFVRR